jgi:hypothetical protein
MRRCSLVVLLLIACMIGIPARPAAARQICFPDQPSVGACLEEPFSGYWESNGGLPVFGYPATTAQSQRHQDLNVELLTQWTERTRLEVHPENVPPYTILMGRLGAERMAQLGRDPVQEGRESGPREGCLWFSETGHNVCDQAGGLGFKTYWQTHGLKIAGLNDYVRSLQLFGLPLTAAQMETNSSGVTVVTQWFERARFEWYPDNVDKYKVLLGLLGNEVSSGLPHTALPIFGVEIAPAAIGATAAMASAAGLTWVRYNNIAWSAAEPSRGSRDWARMNAIDAQLQALSAQGLTTIVTVHDTPAWAQQFPGVACGAIKAEALDAFAAFMHDLVARYSRPPYNVRYWEIWNEPDVDPALINHNSVFGCWGDAKDPDYGGGAYAEMLKRVYPAIKQADPAAQVVFGGLLLDCDPDHPPVGKDCQSARFLEGVLRGGGGAAFDILAYHGYSYWGRINQDWDPRFGGWIARGGAVLGKLAFLRAVLARYNLVKPIILNEAGLLCVRSCPHKQYDLAQANYVVRLYTRAWAHGLIGVLWFTLNGPGWREAGLLDAGQAPRPGYQALKFLATRLQGAEYVGPLSSGALEGYIFRKGTTIYQVCWTNDGSVVTLPLPPMTSAVYDKLGKQLTLKGTSLEVGFEPLVIEGGS